MELPLVAEKVAIALGLGLLVGLQRERVQSPLAGIRTFALITVLGAVCSLLGLTFGGWVVAAGGLAVAAMLVVGNLATGKGEEVEPGLTTEMAALLMYGVGAYLVVGHTPVAVAVGGGVALLLHWKAPMHQFVARIGEDDVRAMMRFVLVALVIYPVLPNRGYGPYEVLNPQHIWLMVVLIVGLSLGGYVAYKLLGRRSGAVAAGLLGGLISSTATTVSHARRARDDPAETALAGLVIVLASTVALVRVLAEMAVVAPTALARTAAPLAVLLAWAAVIAAACYRRARVDDPPGGTGQQLRPLDQGNPAELRPALIFAGLYAAVLFATSAARDYFGARGLYAVALLSGLHDLDAITLSTARLVEQGQVEPALGWRVVLAAFLSNLAFKAALAGVLGGRRLLRWVALPLGAVFLGGAALLVLWPQP